jgi:hypothetical protein
MLDKAIIMLDKPLLHGEHLSWEDFILNFLVPAGNYA